MKYVLRGQRQHRWLLIGFVASVLLLFGAGATYYMLRQEQSKNRTAETPEQPELTQDVVYTADIVFLGDTMLARTVGPAILRGEDPFAHVRPILDAYDIRVANIESVIADPSVATTPANKRYIFNAPLGSDSATLQRPAPAGHCR